VTIVNGALHVTAMARTPHVEAEWETQARPAPRAPRPAAPRALRPAPRGALRRASEKSRPL